MDVWLKLILAMLNRGACWTDRNAQIKRCTLY